MRRFRRGEGGRFAGAFVGAWFGVVAAATACALELAVSGTTPLGVVVPAMVGVHALIGIGEGLITAVAVAAVRVSRPDLLELVRGGETQ